MSCNWRLFLKGGLLALLATVFPPGIGPALADTIHARSGEHPGFSRIVLDLGTLPDWSLSRNGTTRALTFAGPLVRVDVSDIYKRMSRRRVSSVSAGVNEIRLDLACACLVSVYGLPGGRLVVDVRDRTTTSARAPTHTRQLPTKRITTGFARPLVLNEEIGTTDIEKIYSTGPTLDLPDGSIGSDLPASFAENGVRSPTRRSGPKELPRVQGEVPPRDQARRFVSVSNQTFDRNNLSSLESVSMGGDIGEYQRLNAATTALSEALERAGDLGLVERVPTESRAPDSAPARRPRFGNSLPLPLKNSSGFRISTSIDQDFAALARALSGNASEVGCLSDHDLNIGSWGDPDAGFSGFGALRAGLFGEFDEPNLEQARLLTRSYLYWSFGAEAKAMLDAFPFEQDERAVLSFLAEIAEGDTRSQENEAAALLNCPGPISLWAIISIDDPPPGVEIAKSEIAGSFSALPHHLRRQFGPTLVQRFLDLDDPGTARVIWNAVDRAGGKSTEEFILATADLAAANGDHTAAERDYEALESGSPANAPTAVLQYIRSHLSRGAVPGSGIIETAAALGFENRGTDLARELKIEELRGRTALGQWDRVFEELPRAEFAGSLSAADRAQLLAGLYISMAGNAGTTAFLRRALESDARLGVDAVVDPARRAVAERLTRLGFGSAAAEILNRISSPRRDDNLLAARAKLEEGNASAALTLLEGFEARDARLIRAEAYLRLGELSAARLAFEQAGKTDAAASIARRIGAWSSGNDPISRAASEVLSSETVAPETPLARNRALAVTSSDLRSDVARLRQSVARAASGAN